MSDRIDHVAEAVDLLKNTPIPERAQVHATLALVEQQRVANLIALAGQVAEPIDGGRVGTSTSGVVWMRTEAARLLGIPEILPEPFGGQA